MVAEELTLGEYMRRRRRAKKWNLLGLSQATGISYTHLSRIENDSAVPKAETIAKLSDALDGDLKLMLELAGNLPQKILDRIRSEQSSPNRDSLKRSAGRSAPKDQPSMLMAQAVSLARAQGLDEADAVEVAESLLRFLKLDRRQREAIASVMETMEVAADENWAGSGSS